MSREHRSRTAHAVAYVRRNYPMIVLDVLVIGSWLVLGTHLFDALGVPRWLQYALVFLGVVAYTQVTPQWEAVGD